jgi:hypothetical protein
LTFPDHLQTPCDFDKFDSAIKVHRKNQHQVNYVEVNNWKSSGTAQKQSDSIANSGKQRIRNIHIAVNPYILSTRKVEIL